MKLSSSLVSRSVPQSVVLAMASPRNAMFILTIIAAFGVCFGAVYRVGDDSGWHPMFDYQKWASSKNFSVGDTIRFEYNSMFHNVKEVTKRNYKTCDATSPIATHYTGNDTFILEKPGHRYFICGFPNHCKNGQKVDIYVHEVYSPSPGPDPSCSPPLPPSPAAKTPAGTKSASSIQNSNIVIATKSLAVLLLAFCV